MKKQQSEIRLERRRKGGRGARTSTVENIITEGRSEASLHFVDQNAADRSCENVRSSKTKRKRLLHCVRPDTNVSAFSVIRTYNLKRILGVRACSKVLQNPGLPVLGNEHETDQTHKLSHEFLQQRSCKLLASFCGGRRSRPNCQYFRNYQ